MPKSDFHFHHTLRVRWSEIDRQGIVFNGHYLTYFDVGMTEYLREIGFPYPQGLIERGTDFYMKKGTIEYHGSPGYDDLLEIHTRISRVGVSSLTFDFEIYRQGADELLTSGQNVYVNVDIASRKSAPLPEELKRKIATLEGRV